MSDTAMSDTSEESENTSDKPRKPIINLDADPHNANWLRILEEQQQEQQEQPHSSDQRDQNAP